MEYYFNELSITEESPDLNQLSSWVASFVKTCILTKYIGYTRFRSYYYIADIQINPNYVLRDWLKNRSLGDRDTKRKFKSLISATPLLQDEDELKAQFEYSIFKFQNKESKGLGVAYLKNSIAVGFPSNENWLRTEVELEQETINFETEETTVNTVNVLFASSPRHISKHKLFAIEQLKQQNVPANWKPEDLNLPNSKQSNQILKPDRFYKTVQKKARNEKVALFRTFGKDIAELNFYKKNQNLSQINSNPNQIRDIYESQNSAGNKIYLSIDIEKGAFEVCDFRGRHLKEILFNGHFNSGAQANHSIKLQA